MPVGNNEHQKIDDLSTELMAYSIQRQLVLHYDAWIVWLFCQSVTMTIPLSDDMPL